MFKLVPGCYVLVDTFIGCKLELIPSTIQTLEVRAEFLRRLFNDAAGNFAEQVLASVVDVVETPRPISELHTHVLSTTFKRDADEQMKLSSSMSKLLHFHAHEPSHFKVISGLRVSTVTISIVQKRKSQRQTITESRTKM
jgi:hypothetical protein